MVRTLFAIQMQKLRHYAAENRTRRRARGSILHMEREAKQQARRPHMGKPTAERGGAAKRRRVARGVSGGVASAHRGGAQVPPLT